MNAEKMYPSTVVHTSTFYTWEQVGQRVLSVLAEDIN